MKELYASVGDLGGGNEKESMEGVSDLMKILGKISESDEKAPNQNGGDEMKFMFEQLFDVLLKDDVLSGPLMSIQTKLKEYVIKNKEKISKEDSDMWKIGEKIAIIIKN